VRLGHTEQRSSVVLNWRLPEAAMASPVAFGGRGSARPQGRPAQGSRGCVSADVSPASGLDSELRGWSGFGAPSRPPPPSDRDPESSAFNRAWHSAREPGRPAAGRVHNTRSAGRAGLPRSLGRPARVTHGAAPETTLLFDPWVRQVGSAQPRLPRKADRTHLRQPPPLEPRGDARGRRRRREGGNRRDSMPGRGDERRREASCGSGLRARPVRQT
jgi:hypothetical protein